MPRYESSLGHKLDLDTLRNVISSRYQHRTLKGCLRVYINGYRKNFNFNLHENGKIIFDADSLVKAKTRIYKIIDWLKEQQIIILVDEPGVREL